jgi:hypothetical protein
MEYSDSNSSISECVICLEELNSDYYTLPCSHVIHKDCFHKYVSYNTKDDLEKNGIFTECPICKTKIEIKKENKDIQFCLYIGASLFVFSCTFIISNILLSFFKIL